MSNVVHVLILSPCETLSLAACSEEGEDFSTPPATPASWTNPPSPSNDEGLETRFSTPSSSSSSVATEVSCRSGAHLAEAWKGASIRTTSPTETPPRRSAIVIDQFDEKKDEASAGNGCFGANRSESRSVGSNAFVTEKRNLRTEIAAFLNDSDDESSSGASEGGKDGAVAWEDASGKSGLSPPRRETKNRSLKFHWGVHDGSPRPASEVSASQGTTLFAHCGDGSKRERKTLSKETDDFFCLEEKHSRTLLQRARSSSRNSTPYNGKTADVSLKGTSEQFDNKNTDVSSLRTPTWCGSFLISEENDESDPCGASWSSVSRTGKSNNVHSGDRQSGQAPDDNDHRKNTADFGRKRFSVADFTMPNISEDEVHHTQTPRRGTSTDCFKYISKGKEDKLLGKRVDGSTWASNGQRGSMGFTPYLPDDNEKNGDDDLEWKVPYPFFLLGI